uniref:Glypican 5b n=1 Tax=Salarias fasciatus TaxID=181472 RepID=A0A672HM64_SALFA
MFRAAFRNVDLFGVILLCLVVLPRTGCRSAGADSCHEVKTAYMMRQIGPVELVPDSPGTDKSLRVCVHPGPSCCTSRWRVATWQLFAVRQTFESLVSFTSNLTSSLFDSAYSTLASDCHPLVLQLFNNIKSHLSGQANASLDNAVRQFYNDLFPLVYRRLLNPGIGHTSTQISFHSTNHDDCLRMTQQDISPFGLHPRLLVSSLLAGEVLNATEKVALSRECGQALVRMQYCSHCRGLTLIRLVRGCVAISDLGAPWGGLVVLLQRLAATLATSSNHNSLELALLAVQNHVNDAILHAQLHGHASQIKFECFSVFVCRSFPLKGSRGDKSRSLKKLSREFEGSIQRYQWFFSELPEMLCESEMEVEQHTCWSGEDVVESYAGRVVGSTLKAQSENPEMTVRNTDPVLKGFKQKLEQPELPRHRHNKTKSCKFPLGPS